jgi:DNA-binding LacI/PurR family transcriptional regulator
VKNAVKENFQMPERSMSQPETPPKRRPTSTDVARLAGVSRTQVSYVLNNTGSAHVSEDKRARIFEAAKELGYFPHQSAQALRRGFSNEFCMFFPAPYTPRINEILGTIHELGLTQDCVATQYSFNSYRDPARMLEAFNMLIARRPRGLFCSLMDISEQEILLARDKGIQHILVLDVEQHKEYTTLYIPAEPVGYLAARHLLQLGHRRLGVIHPADPVQGRAFALRLKGMRRAMAGYEEATLQILDWPKEDIRPTLEYAERFVQALLQKRQHPTGIYTYSDDYAYPFMACLRQHAIQVPRDIALIGTDDLPHSALLQPSLSSIQMDATSLGERAVALINSLITGEEPEARFLRPPEPILIQRESTGKAETGSF